MGFWLDSNSAEASIQSIVHQKSEPTILFRSLIPSQGRGLTKKKKLLSRLVNEVLIFSSTKKKPIIFILLVSAVDIDISESKEKRNPKSTETF